MSFFLSYFFSGSTGKKDRLSFKLAVLRFFFSDKFHVSEVAEEC